MGIHRAMKLAGGVERGAGRHSGGDVFAVEGGRVGVEAPHRRGSASSRGGSWAACSGRTPRTFAKVTPRSPPRCSQSGTEPPLAVETKDTSLLHCTQRPHQRLPSRPGRQGRGQAGLREPAVIRLSVCRRRGRSARTTTPNAGRGFRGMEATRPSDWAADSSWRRADPDGGHHRDVRDAATGSLSGRRPR